MRKFLKEGGIFVSTVIFTVLTLMYITKDLIGVTSNTMFLIGFFISGWFYNMIKNIVSIIDGGIRNEK